MKSYSFLLHTPNFGSNTRTMINPFTKEKVEAPIDIELTEEQLESLDEVFDIVGLEGPEDHGEGYVFHTSTGESVRFRCWDLTEEPSIIGLPVEILTSNVSDVILSTVFEVASRTQMLLMDSFGDHVRTVSCEPTEAVLKRHPTAAALHTLNDLRKWLDESIGAHEVAD